MNHLGDTNKMVETPRTPRMDWVAGHARGIADAAIVAEGIKLERELNRACEMYRKLDIYALKLEERIKRLEEAGDYLCAAAAFMGWHDKIETWNKAKECK